MRSRLSNYADDIMGFPRSELDLVRHFGAFLRLCADHNVTLAPHKTRFGFDHETFFGFCVNAKGRFPTDKNLDPLRNFTSPPDNLSELRAFLGISVQVREFIPNFATMCIPLHRLLKKNEPWNWGGEQDKAFQEIKTKLLSGVSLRAPDFSLPFSTQSDASDFGYGGCIAQWDRQPCSLPDCSEEADLTPKAYRGARRFFCSQECYDQWRKTGMPPISPEEQAQGGRRVIAWFSRAFTPTQCKWPVFHKEAFSLLTAISKAKKYAIASPCALNCHADHVSLSWCKQSDKNAAPSWLVDDLSNARFEVWYSPGAGPVHQLADQLSRTPCCRPQELTHESLAYAVKKALAFMGSGLKRSAQVAVFATGPFSTELSRMTQRWKTTDTPVKQLAVQSALQHKKLELIIAIPTAAQAPVSLCQLLEARIPFALLCPSSLVDDACQLQTKDANAELTAKLAKCAKMVFLRAEFAWIFGNHPSLEEKAEVYHLELETVPCQESYAAVLARRLAKDDCAKFIPVNP